MARTGTAINKQRVLSALTDADTFTAAAAAAGVSRRTLFNYLRDDAAFAREYRNQCDFIAIERAEAAQADRRAALDALRDIMNDKQQAGAVRVKAAAALIEHADAALQGGTVAAQRAVESHSDFFMI